MKTNRTMALLTVCGALAISAGCTKNDGNAPPVAKDAQKPVDAAPAVKAVEAAQVEAMLQQAAAEKLVAERKPRLNSSPRLSAQRPGNTAGFRARFTRRKN